MAPEWLALLAATSYAGGSVAVKRATRHPGALPGFVLGLFAATGGLAMLMTATWRMPWATVALFAGGGVVGAGIGSALAMRGVRDAGASVGVPLQSSANPVAATLAGVVVFGEHVGLVRAGALGLIIVGILLCLRGGSANMRTALGQAWRHQPPWLLAAVPLAAGVAFAGGDTLRKLALVEGGDPFAGAAIAAAAAFLGWLPVLLHGHGRPGRTGRLAVGPGAGWFVLGGLFTGTAQVLTLFALARGDISVVSPILAAQPIVVILLGAAFLRDVERLRPAVVLGALVVSGGVVVIAST